MTIEELVENAKVTKAEPYEHPTLGLIDDLYTFEFENIDNMLMAYKMMVPTTMGVNAPSEESAKLEAIERINNGISGGTFDAPETIAMEESEPPREKSLFYQQQEMIDKADAEREANGE